MSDAAEHGVNKEEVLRKATPSEIAEARHALGIAISLLLSPPNAYGKSGDKAFYAHFLMNADKHIVTEIPNYGPLPTAAITVRDKIELYINPIFFLGLTINKRMELLIHELEHVMNLHFLQTKKLIDEEGGEKANLKNIMKMANVAQDALINVPLTDLTEKLGVTIERLNKQLEEYGSGIRIESGDNSQVVYWKIRQFQEEMGDKLPSDFGQGEDGECDDHGLWKDSEGNEELAKGVVRDAANKAANATGIGNCPAHILKQLGELNKSLVNWKRQLQQVKVRTQ
jgi:predicted metal-dependent peptidase